MGGGSCDGWERWEGVELLTDLGVKKLDMDFWVLGWEEIGFPIVSSGDSSHEFWPDQS